MNDLVNASFPVPLGWRHGHLQSIRSRVLPQAYPLIDVITESRMLLVDMHDESGDRLVATVHRSRSAERRRGGPALVVLIHGLGGSAESSYIRATARGLLMVGHNVLRIDLRGAGWSGDHAQGLYHAGRTEDVRDVLRQAAALPEARDEQGEVSLAVMGFSLGGNMTLKLLGEPLEDVPVHAGIAVSAPLDLSVGAEHLHHMWFGFYERFVLSGLREDLARSGPASGLTPAEVDAVARARTLIDFDNAVTAPRNGWVDAAEYYAVNSSAQYLPRIETPTLVIHAIDDPMIPAGPYQAIDWDGLAQDGPVRRLITPHGGHVGFHERGKRFPWYVGQTVRFLAGVR